MPVETSPDPRAAVRRVVAAMLLVVLAALVGGCGSDTPPEDERPIAGSQLAVYASAPLHGPSGEAGKAILRAQRLALAHDGGRVGRYRIRLVTLDAARPFTGGSDPVKVSLNARRAARDPRAVAYLGEVRSGASAISIPILNEAGMLAVSPLDSALGLTTHTAAITGSPVRYYPNAERVGRTFARLVPSDDAQAEALLAYMQREDVKRIALLTDEDPPGLALADAVRAVARAHGVTVAVVESVDAHAQQHPELVEAVLARRLDAVLYAGGKPDVAVRVWRELASADPQLKLFAPSALADPSFAARVAAVGGGTYVTRPLLPLGAYPPTARRFARSFAAAHGEAPPPEALYGYESMRSVLGAIRAAERGVGDGSISRSDVVRAFFDAGRRDGVLGAYRIDARGDTSLQHWGAFRLDGGRLRFESDLTG